MKPFPRGAKRRHAVRRPIGDVHAPTGTSPVSYTWKKGGTTVQGRTEQHLHDCLRCTRGCRHLCGGSGGRLQCSDEQRHPDGKRVDDGRCPTTPTSAWRQRDPEHCGERTGSSRIRGRKAPLQSKDPTPMLLTQLPLSFWAMPRPMRRSPGRVQFRDEQRTLTVNSLTTATGPTDVTKCVVTA